jgi:hypothetical protein
MMDLNGFDANTVEPNAPREVLPAGWYKCVFTKSEEKPTKAQTGSYLQINAEILNNPNVTAVEIAQRTLSAICRAVGVMTPRNSDELHDKPLMVKVKVKAAEGAYAAQNEIEGYEPVSGGTTKAEAKATGGATPPWKRK